MTLDLHRSTRCRSLLAASLLGVLLTACGGSATDGPPAAQDGAAAEDAQPRPTAGITFEPAYPADVSAEGLSQQDAVQQEEPHSHDDGEEHTHADEEADAEEEGDHGHPH